MLFQCCCPSRWPGKSTWWRRMWIRSGHRAHGLDTYICIYLHTFFLLQDFATFWQPLIPCIMYIFLCSGVVKYIPTRRGGSKSFSMNHSPRVGFSDSELPGQIVGKSRKHVLRCASVSRNITPAGHVPFFFGYAAIQLARQVQQERTQVVCSNKVVRKRLARRHSHNGP